MALTRAMCLAAMALTATATPEVAKVTVHDVSRDSVRDGRCSRSGAFARDGRLMMVTHLFHVDDDGSTCDTEPFVHVLRWDDDFRPHAWSVAVDDDLRKLPRLAAANEKFGGYAVLFGEPGDYDFEYWDEWGEGPEDHRNLDYDWNLYRMVLLDDGRVVATTDDNRVLTFNWLNSASRVDEVRLNRMSNVEFLACDSVSNSKSTATRAVIFGCDFPRRVFSPVSSLVSSSETPFVGLSGRTHFDFGTGTIPRRTPCSSAETTTIVAAWRGSTSTATTSR